MKLSDSELRKLVSAINETFYDAIFDDPWLGQVFDGVPEEHIKNQQTDFIVGAFGGDNVYVGRSPRDAHPHIMIETDMWELRELYLIKAFEKNNAPDWLQEKWLKIDEAFKKNIIKFSVTECSGRYPNEPIIDIPNPFKKIA